MGSLRQLITLTKHHVKKYLTCPYTTPLASPLRPLAPSTCIRFLPADHAYDETCTRISPDVVMVRDSIVCISRYFIAGIHCVRLCRLLAHQREVFNRAQVSNDSLHLAETLHRWSLVQQTTDATLPASALGTPRGKTPCLSRPYHGRL